MNKFNDDFIYSIIGKKDIKIGKFYFRPLLDNKGLFFKEDKTEEVDWFFYQENVISLTFKNNINKIFYINNDECFLLVKKNNKYLKKKKLKFEILDREKNIKLNSEKNSFKNISIFFCFYLLETILLQIIFNNIYFIDLNYIYFFIISLFFYYYTFPFIKKLIHKIS